MKVTLLDVTKAADNLPQVGIDTFSKAVIALAEAACGVVFFLVMCLFNGISCHPQ